jgi:SAM-dependent methyltransferase
MDGDRTSLVAVPIPGGEPRGEARIPYTGCPLCQNSEIPFLLEADCTTHPLYHRQLPPTIRWHRCVACDHVFTNGYFTAAAAELVFGDTNAAQRVGVDMEGQRWISARMVAKVARHIHAGAWLDIGFGNGSLIFVADEFGYRASGIDLRRESVAALQSFGFEAHCMAIEELDKPGHYSVVSMADVLEHMPFPKKGLDAAHRLLRPGGALLVSMPNMDCTVWRTLNSQKVNPYWGEIEHYHNFGRRRLYALLQEHGFTAVEYGVSERYRACMEVIAVRGDPSAPEN